MVILLWLRANWKFIAFALLLSASFYAGWYINGWRWEAKAYAIEQRAEQERIALAQSNAELIEAAENKEAKIIHDTKIVYKTITRLKPAQCLDSMPSFRAIWNGQAAGQAGKPAD